MGKDATTKLIKKVSILVGHPLYGTFWSQKLHRDHKLKPYVQKIQKPCKRPPPHSTGTAMGKRHHLY